VRINEAGDHEEWLSGPSRFQGLDAQPANALARDRSVISEAAERIAADIATSTEYVDAVSLLSRTIVDRRLGVEILLVHLELAEVRRFVPETFQHDGMRCAPVLFSWTVLGRLLPVTGLESAGFDRCVISYFASRPGELELGSSRWTADVGIALAISSLASAKRHLQAFIRQPNWPTSEGDTALL